MLHCLILINAWCDMGFCFSASLSLLIRLTGDDWPKVIQLVAMPRED